MAAISFPELQSKVNDYAADCYDAVSATKTMQFCPDSTVTYGPKGSENVRMGGKLSPKAMEQIAWRLQGPGTWLMDQKKCPDELRVRLLNDLVEMRKESKLLIRSKGDMIRAILSDEYTPFDNKPVIDMVGEALNTLGDGIEVKVVRAEVGDELRAYVLLPGITFDADPSLGGSNSKYGDGGLHPGVYIRNGETGGTGLKILGGLFRGVCQNGMIYGWNSDESTTIRHRWHTVDFIKGLLAEKIASGLKLSEEAARNFVASQEVKVEKTNLRSLVDGWTKNYGVTVEAGTNWLATIASQSAEYGRVDDPRAFDLINAATLVAQSRPNEEREQMERMSGDLLSSFFPRQQVLVED